MNFREKVDSTLLRADATHAEIVELCREACEQGFAAVCVNPSRLELVVRNLENAGVASCTVAAFPLGAEPVEAKVEAVKRALGMGAAEIDMVMNIGAVKDKDFLAVSREIRESVRAVREGGGLLKLIVETALLNEEELSEVCRLAVNEGVDFIKTSTGFSTRGATVEDVVLIRKCVGTQVGVKASGGIRTWQSACDLVTAGADRLGISNAGRLLSIPTGVTKRGLAD